MSKLVNDNSSLEVSVPVRIRGIPEIHPATTILTVGRRHKVGIVIATAILGVGDDSVVLRASAPEVVLLEVAGNFVEAISMK